jgi:hypothetical protein
MVVKKEETRDFMDIVHKASGIKEAKKEPIKKEKIEMPQKRENMEYSSPQKKENVEKILVENFVSLQKVMTNLAVKFDNLSDQISKLLELFEISAKAMAEKGYSMGEDKKILEKLDALLEHNKVIAKGIALLHERGMPEEQEVVIMPQEQFSQPPPQRIISRMPPQQQGKFQRQIQSESPKTRFVTEA